MDKKRKTFSDQCYYNWSTNKIEHLIDDGVLIDDKGNVKICFYDGGDDKFMYDLETGKTYLSTLAFGQSKKKK